MRITMPFLVLSLVAAQAHSNDALTAYGVGAQGCGKYIEQRRTPNKYYDNLVGAWFSGFLSAYNYYGTTPQVQATLDQDTVLAYFDKYCRDAPLASISLGAVQLTKAYVK